MKTKVSYVRKGSKSLKVIIPEAVVDILKLSHGDMIEWEITAKGDRILVSISKLE